MIAETSEWVPPTEDHVEFKNFMIKQLQDTLERDGDASYWENLLEESYKKLESPIDLDSIKKDLRESYEYDVETRQKRLDEEIERCESANEWVDKLLKSVE
jgi:hypothetical protein